jgi:hypothetical protein
VQELSLKNLNCKKKGFYNKHEIENRIDSSEEDPEENLCNAYHQQPEYRDEEDIKKSDYEEFAFENVYCKLFLFKVLI